MAKRTRIARAEYKTLADIILCCKYNSPSILARLLIETWSFENGNITAEWWTREKVCAKGNFTKLRSKLIEDGFMLFNEQKKRYFPGPRLRPYLEKFEKNRTATIADLNRFSSDLREVRDDVQDLKAQMHEIREILAEIKRLQAPPPSREAQEKSAELTKHLEQLLKQARLQ